MKKTKTKTVAAQPVITEVEPTPASAADNEPNLDLMKFSEDYRESNPKLHMLYTKWAIPHLVEIDKALRKFDSFSNLNMLGVTIALFKEREKLVKENAAYAEADAILKTIQKCGGYPQEAT